MLICLSMLCSLVVVPYSVSAATSATAGGITENNGVTLDWNKNVRDNGDGTYTLSLSAKTKISHTALNTDIYTAENGYYEVPADGKYIIQAWGSKGGKGSTVNTAIIGSDMKEGGQGGQGGYVEGAFELKKGQKIAYTIGSNGSTTNTAGVGGGVNGSGGSHGGYGSYGVGGGGGYTAVYVYDENDEISYNHESNYVLIAGGGGGGGAGHSSQTKTPDGGNAGNMNTSANAQLTAEQNNGVAGTYYAGSNGKSNSDNDDYVGQGATNIPGDSNSSVWGWISATSGNDWLATYNPDKEGGLGGDGNGRGGAGGAGFAGGGGGVQHNIISAWDCGGGGGGSSFIAANAKIVDESYRIYMASENASTTGGSVVIIPIIDNIDNISTLNNTTISGTISEYFEIVSGGTVSGSSFTFNNVDLEPSMTSDSQVETVKIVVKPREGFAGGNSVPVLENMMVSNDNYIFNIDEKADTDYVNVPWTHKIITNTIYAEPGDTLTTADLYVDDNGRENVGTDNYGFISEISEYSVEGVNGDTFTAPDETTRYTVSYTVTATNDAAKVGTPVNGTISATAVVDVSGLAEVPVDGAKNGYNKTLRYNSETNTYDLVIEHTVSALEGIGSKVSYTDTFDLVGAYTTEGYSGTHTITEDGYYLILLRGADGGDGGDTCGDKTEIAGSGGGHRHGYGGAGAAGGNAYLIGRFDKGAELNLNVGSAGTSQGLVSGHTYWLLVTQIEGPAVANAGTAGGNTTISMDGTYLAVASGGAGGGGSYALNGNDDYWGHGYAAEQGTTDVSDMEISLPSSTNGTNGAQSGRSTNQLNMAFDAGKSGTSYVYAPYALDNFTFAEPYYETIKDTDDFKALINIETVEASTARAHQCDGSGSNGPPQPNAAPAETLEKSHIELTNLKNNEGNYTAGIKIYKISRTKTETEIPGVREKLNLGGEISKYFTINSIDVDGATYDEPVISNGEGDATSIFTVSNVTAKDNDTTITYTINLSPKAGFLGGNDVPIFGTDGEYPTGLRITRSDITEDTADDIGDLEPKNSSDHANVSIADYEFNLVTYDKTIIKGESVNVSELYDDVTPLPSDWTADYVQLKASLEGTNGADTVSPDVTTEYMLSVELASKNANEKAVVAQATESVKSSKPATVYVEYSVTYDVSNITPSNTDNAQYHKSYTTVLNSGGYVLPDAITVTMGENALAQGTDYTYDKATGRVYINEGVIEDNITISAVATVQTYTLTYAIYDKDGELSKTETQEYEIGAKIDHTWANNYATEANQSADVGYTFRWAWNTDDGEALDVMPGHNVQVDGFYDKTAYTLTVNYVYEDGATAAESFTQKYYWDDTYSVDSPVIDGYIADKATVSGTMQKSDTEITVTYTKLEAKKYPLIIYYKYEDGTDAAASYSATLEEGASYEITSPVVKGYIANQTTVSGTMTTSGATVTVIYTEDITEVTVSFNAQGGSLAVGDESKTVYCGNGRTYGSLPTPVKSGAKFLGWFTEVSGGTEVTSTTEVTNNSNHTLYARWEEITASVVYNANGGTFTGGTTLTVTGTYGESYPTAGETPTRAGFKFTGWYTDAGASTAFNTEVTFSYTSPRTLYAGWNSTDSAAVVFKNGNVEVEKYTFDPGTTLEAEKITPPTAGGYFKGWYDEDGVAETLVLDYYEKKNGNNSFSVTDATDEANPFLINYRATWYDASTLGDACVSDAKAQAVTLASDKKAIRFLALIDNGYNTYKKAGFVISTVCPTPTIESGYQYSSQGTIYKKIYATKADGTAGWLDIAYLSENTFSFSNGAGLLYTNLIIKDGNEDKIYYATPYIINASDEYVYGETRAISYNELIKLDAEVAANQK